MKFLFTIILLVIATANSSAQIVYTAKVDTVALSGYYNIELSPAIIAVSQAENFPDLRLRDNKNKEIPYLVRSQNPVSAVNEFVNYALLKNTVKDSLNIVVVENKSRAEMSRFYISVASADVSKYAVLRGSNDQKQWYIVKQQENISNSGFENEGNEILTIDFPKGNYVYYELVLSNNQSSPLKVQAVGTFKNSNIYAQLTEINTGKFVQVDSTNKKTYIHFPELAYNYRINKLSFEVENKGVYLRNGYIGNNYAPAFQLSSKGNNAFFINTVSLARQAAIIIENNDNPPLHITDVKAYGINRYICAYLEKGQAYTLTINTAEATTPQYDIQNMKDDIPQDIPIVKTATFTKTDNTPPPREKMWIEKPVFLWSMIIIIGAFLSLICLKMIKELRKKK